MWGDLSRLLPQTKVRFAAARLAVLSLPDRRRLEGRVGIVQPYRKISKKPYIYFPTDDSRDEIRLEVDRGHLEIVELPPPEPEVNPIPEMPSEKPQTESGNLSQSELDDLFG